MGTCCSKDESDKLEAVETKVRAWKKDEKE